jgi:hypothetical protein
MGRQSDWLYELIFDEVEKVWEQANKEGAGRFGPAPSDLLISEMHDADWEESRCRGNPDRQWTYQGGQSLSPAEVSAIDVGERRGMFYERGVVAFCIDSDRKRLVFSYILGPRYGRGMTFVVIGQGAKGRLSPSGICWVS